MARLLICAYLILASACTASAQPQALPSQQQSQPQSQWPQVNRDDNLRDFVLSLIAERDRLYNLRADLQDKANMQRFESMERANSLALSVAKDAVSKAETAAEKRFDSVNEFRSTLKDQQQTLMPRVEAESRLKGIEERMALIQNRLDIITGNKQGTDWLWGVLIAAAIGAAIIFGFLFNTRRGPQSLSK